MSQKSTRRRIKGRRGGLIAHPQAGAALIRGRRESTVRRRIKSRERTALEHVVAQTLRESLKRDRLRRKNRQDQSRRKAEVLGIEKNGT